MMTWVGMLKASSRVKPGWTLGKFCASTKPFSQPRVRRGLEVLLALLPTIWHSARSGQGCTGGAREGRDLAFLDLVGRRVRLGGLDNLVLVVLVVPVILG